MTELPWTITAGWIVVLAWSVGQVLMWKRLRTAAFVPPPVQKSKVKRERPAWRPRRETPTTIFTAPAVPDFAPPPEFVETPGMHILEEPSTESVYR